MELRFAALYMANGRNGTRAYMVLFPRSGEAAARAHAVAWVAKSNVQDEIAKLTNEAWKREHMSADEVLGRIARIAKQNIADYYWKPGELNRAGEETEVGRRKPLSELTEQQTECIKGFKFSATGLVIQEHYDKAAQLMNMAKHHKLMSDSLSVNLTMPLDKMIEQSYGENKAGGA